MLIQTKKLKKDKMWKLNDSLLDDDEVKETIARICEGIPELIAKFAHKWVY